MLFLTQEIGSIQRPLWRQKLNSPANFEWIKWAIEWGDKLGVNEKNELVDLLSKDGRLRSQEEKQRMIDLASIYVIRMFEKV